MSRQHWTWIAPLLVLAGCTGTEIEPGDLPDPIDHVDPGEVAAVELRPSDVAIDTSSVLSLKAHVVADDGGLYDLSPQDAVYEVDDPKVAVVDTDGRVVPMAEGSVAVTATYEGVTSEPAVVRVVAPGQVRVRVVDLGSGAPLAAASVWVGDEEVSGPWFTGGDGTVDVQGDFAGALTVTADFDGYRRSSLVGVVAREVRVPLQLDGQPPPPSSFSGSVAFPGEPAAGQLSLALSVASIPENPILANLVDFIGEMKDVDAFGLSTQLPENMVVSGVLDRFEAPAEAGPRRVVTLGGIFDIGVLLDLVVRVETYGPGAIFEVLGQHTDDLVFGASEVIDLEEGEHHQGVEVQAVYPLLRETHLTLGPPPDGDFPDPATVLALRESEGAGYVVAGLGIGLNVYPQQGDDDTTGDDDDATYDDKGFRRDGPWETLAIHEANTEGTLAFANSLTRYLASVFEGGLGSGARSSILLSTQISDPELTLPAFLDLTEPHVPTQDEADRSVLTWSGDRGATVQVLTLAAGGGWWDLWCDGWRDSVVVPVGLPPLSDDDDDYRYWLHNGYGVLSASYDSLANDAADEGWGGLVSLLQRRTDALVYWQEPAWP